MRADNTGGNKPQSRRPKKAGHRNWGARGGAVPGEHAGDIMSAETRSALMSRIRSKNTSPERLIAALLRARGCRFCRHVTALPGRPDIVFRKPKVAVFVDGDFWHGWRFPLWRHKLSEKWQLKIAANRARDRRNFRALRKSGWLVIRLWEHQLEQDPERCVGRILTCVAMRGDTAAG